MIMSYSVKQSVNNIGESTERVSLSMKQSLIAVIDDCSLFMSKLGGFLEQLDHKILGISEPMSGMGKLLDAKPELIFLDTHMPTIDGYSVCKFLRSTSYFQETPIILLTEYDNHSEREYASFIKANDIFSKKSNLNNLISIMEKYIPTSTRTQKSYSLLSN